MEQDDADSVMGSRFGLWLSLALTSFVQLPSHELLSVALPVFGSRAPPAIDHSLIEKVFFSFSYMTEFFANFH